MLQVNKAQIVVLTLKLSNSAIIVVVFRQILRLFEEPEYWLSMQRERDEFLSGISSKCEVDLWRRDDSITSDMEDIQTSYSNLLGIYRQKVKEKKKPSTN